MSANRRLLPNSPIHGASDKSRTNLESNFPCLGGSCVNSDPTKRPVKITRARWTREEQIKLTWLRQRGLKWSQVAQHLPERTPAACTIYAWKRKETSLVKSQWSAAEDAVLKRLKESGLPWKEIATQFPKRSVEGCQMRWHQHLKTSPSNRDTWTADEDALLKALKAGIKISWDHVAKQLPRHGTKSCQNRYYKYLKDGVKSRYGKRGMKKAWTAENDEELEALEESGASHEEIAERFPVQHTLSRQDREYHLPVNVAKRALHYDGSLENEDRSMERRETSLDDSEGSLEHLDEVLAIKDKLLEDRDDYTEDGDIYPEDEDGQTEEDNPFLHVGQLL